MRRNCLMIDELQCFTRDSLQAGVAIDQERFVDGVGQRLLGIECFVSPLFQYLENLLNRDMSTFLSEELVYEGLTIVHSQTMQIFETAQQVSKSYCIPTTDISNVHLLA